ncbi:MAG: UDP-glucose 4-epimerase [Bacteroidetes bacterium CG12_big_fil_rev_8_21_14_0_65_60_17]|nr:MAG: UDP-glucose 4-epimerase [Bacteroidetes bacterium CG12_big_fil_rev_8_21_14_0_65_60_17]
MTILVTGGAGFIGSHIVDALLAAGHDVHILDDLSGGFRHNVPPGAILHESDVRDPDLANLWKEYGYEVVFHLAAQMDVRRSVADPAFDADVNIGGLLNVLEAGRSRGLRHVIFSSTGGAIYGEPQYVPQDEEHLLNPLSPYGITKLCSEKYLHFYHHTYDISWTALRYGNVYGPRQNPHGEAGVVAIFAQRLLAGLPTVVNGDGQQTRDYVHVRDVVAANMAALEKRCVGTINIGTGVETNVNQLFRIVRDTVAPGVAVKHGPGKPGEQRRSVLSWAKAQRSLDWKPTIGVEDGLRETAAWFMQQNTINRP